MRIVQIQRGDGGEAAVRGDEGIQLREVKEPERVEEQEAPVGEEERRQAGQIWSELEPMLLLSRQKEPACCVL